MRNIYLIFILCLFSLCFEEYYSMVSSNLVNGEYKIKRCFTHLDMLKKFGKFGKTLAKITPLNHQFLKFEPKNKGNRVLCQITGDNGSNEDHGISASCSDKYYEKEESSNCYDESFNDNYYYIDWIYVDESIKEWINNSHENLTFLDSIKNYIHSKNSDNKDKYGLISKNCKDLVKHLIFKITGVIPTNYSHKIKDIANRLINDDDDENVEEIINYYNEKLDEELKVLKYLKKLGKYIQNFELVNESD